MENLQLSRIDRSEITGIIEVLDEVEAKKLHQDFYFSKNLGLTIFLGKPYAIGVFPKDEKPIRKTKKRLLWLWRCLY